MNGANRLAIVLFAALTIVAMAMIMFIAWSAPDDTIDRLGDFVEYLAAHNTDSGKLIVTLAAMMTAVIGLLIIIIELAPEDFEQELKVQHGGTTTIVPAEALRLRLEEALMALPSVSAAKTRVAAKDKGIAVSMNVTVPPGTNVGHVTEDASRVAVETIERDLGLPAAGKPVVHVVFGAGKPAQTPAPVPAQSPEAAQPEPAAAPATSSWSQPPTPEPATEPPAPEPVSAGEPPAVQQPQAPSWSPPPLHPPETPEEEKRPENPF